MARRAWLQSLAVMIGAVVVALVLVATTGGKFVTAFQFWPPRLIVLIHANWMGDLALGLAAAAVLGISGWEMFRWSFDRKVQWTFWCALGIVAAWLTIWAGSVGYSSLAVVPLGVWALLTAFLLGLALLRLLLSFSHPTIGVARVVLEEAVRLRIALICIVVLVVWIPLIPLRLDPAEQLNYRVQFMLSSTLNATAWILGIMTIMLACATINREIDKKQIHLTFSKPVGRLQYLAGKWLGIMLINLLLVSVSGAGIYVLTQMLDRQPAQSVMDRAILETEVLTAREVAKPEYPDAGGIRKAVEDRIAQLREEKREGFTTDPIDPKLVDGVRAQILADWYHLGMMGYRAEFEHRRYIFSGLTHSDDPVDHVELHVKVSASGRVGDTVHLGMAVNNVNFTPFVPAIVPDAGQSIRIPSSFVENGKLVIDFWLPPIPGLNQEEISQIVVAFGQEDGLEVRHVVGSFDANLVRGLLVIWLKLGFLAALGLTLSTFMAFPVAVLGTLLVFVASEMKLFLHDALEFYIQVLGSNGSMHDELLLGSKQLWGYIISGDVHSAFMMLSKLVADLFVLLVPSFGDYPVVDRLTDGRVISWSEVGGAALWVGVVWTVICGALGWFVFRRRELARVTV